MISHNLQWWLVTALGIALLSIVVAAGYGLALFVEHLAKYKWFIPVFFSTLGDVVLFALLLAVYTYTIYQPIL